MKTQLNILEKIICWKTPFFVTTVKSRKATKPTVVVAPRQKLVMKPTLKELRLKMERKKALKNTLQPPTKIFFSKCHLLKLKKIKFEIYFYI